MGHDEGGDAVGHHGLYPRIDRIKKRKSIENKGLSIGVVLNFYWINVLKLSHGETTSWVS
jgi:hypothetical protein